MKYCLDLRDIAAMHIIMDCNSIDRDRINMIFSNLATSYIGNLKKAI